LSVDYYKKTGDENRNHEHISIKVTSCNKKSVSLSEDTIKIELEFRFSEIDGLLEDNLTIEASSPQWIAKIPIVAFVSE